MGAVRLFSSIVIVIALPKPKGKKRAKKAPDQGLGVIIRCRLYRLYVCFYRVRVVCVTAAVDTEMCYRERERV